MATLTKGKTFSNGELVTPQKLHELIDLGTVSDIDNADISATAAIADTKLAQITTANKVAQSAVTNLTTDLAGKAASSHTHDDRYYTETEMNTFLAGKQASGSYAPATGIAPSAITGTAVITTDSRLSDARTPVSHTHDDRYYTEAEVNTLLAGKQASGSYADATHTHDDRYYTETEMNTLLAGKQAAGSYAPATGIAPSAITGTAVITTDPRLSDARTPTSHTHDDSYYTETEMNTLLAGKQAAGSYAASSHNHDASNITSGTLANARTTATSLSLETYVESNPLDAASYAGQLVGKIAQFNSSSAAINSYVINTFGITSFSSGNNSGVYNVNAVSKSGSTLVQTYIGGILSNNANTGIIYSTASDYRLKTNIEPLRNAVARLLQIPVHRFNWIAAPDSPKVDGFLAHEAQAIVPECAVGSKDEVDAEGKPKFQGIDQSKLVPLLVAAVQELAARVAALEAR